MPSEEDEKNDPQKADEIYESCIMYLRNATRDKKKFSLVFEENINYGFRRNMYGLRKFGIITSSINICGIFLIYYFIENIQDLVWIISNLILSTILLIIWTLIINSDWVKVTADAYAERLLETIDSL